MKRAIPVIVFMLAALLLVIAGCSQAPYTTTPSTQPTTTEPVSPGTEPTMQAAPGGTVDISSFTFIPETVTVKAGESVTWTNSDTVPHTVTGSDGLDSPTMQPGDTYTKKFTDPGEFKYQCSLHPQMTGSVMVK